MQKWPLHPVPLEAESLASWVQRIGKEYNYSFHQMSQLLTNKTYSYISFEQKAPGGVIHTLADATGIPIKNIQNRTHHELVQSSNMDEFERSEYYRYAYIWRHSILCSRNVKTNTFKSCWAWEGRPKSRWPRGCVECLKEEIVYRRINWSFPITTSCPIHARYLQPLNVRHMQVRPQKALGCVSPELLKMDSLTYDGILNGKLNFHGVEMGITRWLSIIRNMIEELTFMPIIRNANQKILTQIWKRAGRRPQNPHTLLFELLNFSQQIRYTHAAAIALDMIAKCEIFPTRRTCAPLAGRQLAF